MLKKIKDLTEEELETIMDKYHESGVYICDQCPFHNMCGNPRAWFKEIVLNNGLEKEIEVEE